MGTTGNVGRQIWIAIARLVLQGTAALGLGATGYMASQIKRETLGVSVLFILIGLLATSLPLGLDALISAVGELTEVQRQAHGVAGQERSATVGK
jgi:hypothetical protein